MYTQSLSSSNFLQGALKSIKPFWDYMSPGVPYDVLMRRCNMERDYSCNRENGVIRLPKVRLLIDLTISHKIELFELTIACWIFQSLKSKDCVILCTKEQVDYVRNYLKNHIPSLLLEIFRIEIKLVSTISDANDSFLIIAQQGDIYHPSFAYTVSLIASQTKAKVVTWNSYQYIDHKVFTKIYRPNIQPLTLLNNDYLGSAFAVSFNEIFKYIKNKNFKKTSQLTSLPFKQWLVISAKAQWITHSEFLCSQLKVNNKINKTLKSALLPDYLSKFIGVPLDLKEENESKFWIPAITPKSITVIIPFKDQISMTLRSVGSVLKQKSQASINIILINNQSQPLELKEIKKKLNSEIKKKRIIIFDYAFPFNHSRQSNIGASLASGEVIVFMNNDAELVETDLLDVLARFTQIKNVATVGCKTIDNNGKLISSGVVAKFKTLHHTDAPVEENNSDNLSNLIREVTGNTFAIAAISKKCFHKIGGLDEKFFPNGYNDAEFCIRALNVGYRHLYIGNRRAFHQPGTSRGKSDETFQKLMLRQKYPWISHQIYNEWKIDDILKNQELLPTKKSYLLTTFLVFLRTNNLLLKKLQSILKGFK